MIVVGICRLQSRIVVASVVSVALLLKYTS